MIPFGEAAGLPPPADLEWLARVVDTLRERAKTLVEMVERGRFYFAAPDTWEPQAAKELFTSAGLDRLALLARRLEEVAGVDAEHLERLSREPPAELSLQLGRSPQLTRLAVPG